MTNSSEAWLGLGGQKSPFDQERDSAAQSNEAQQRKRRPSRRSSSQSYESDRDHVDAMAAIPPGIQEDLSESLEQPEIPGISRLITHAIVDGISRAAAFKRFEVMSSGDPARLKVLKKRYDEEHPR